EVDKYCNSYIMLSFSNLNLKNINRRNEMTANVFEKACRCFLEKHPYRHSRESICTCSALEPVLACRGEEFEAYPFQVRHGEINKLVNLNGELSRVAINGIVCHKHLALKFTARVHEYGAFDFQVSCHEIRNRTIWVVRPMPYRAKAN